MMLDYDRAEWLGQLMPSDRLQYASHLVQESATRSGGIVVWRLRGPDTIDSDLRIELTASLTGAQLMSRAQLLTTYRPFGPRRKRRATALAREIRGGAVEDVAARMSGI